jgi:hypothetical protein
MRTVSSFDHLEIIHVSVTVWGEKYLSLFLSVGVPNLCTLVVELPEEIRRASRVRIFTANEDVARIQAAVELDPLRRRITVEVVAAVRFTDQELYGGYAPMVISQARAVVEASQEGAAIIFMGPDLVYSAGSFKLFVDCANRGCRVVIGPSVRVKRETTAPLLIARIEAHPDRLLDVSAADLAEIAFEQWHEVNDLFVWNAPKSIYWKAYLIYRVAADDVLMRFFQGPTFFAWPKAPLAEYRGWVDHALVSRCCDRYEQVYVVRDSAECITCDLMAGDHREGMAQSRHKELDLLGEMLNLDTINRFNIHYGFHSCRVHRGGVANDEWQAAARRLSSEVDPILKMALPLRVIRRGVATVYPLVSRVISVGRASPRTVANGILRALVRLTAPFLRTGRSA